MTTRLEELLLDLDTDLNKITDTVDKARTALNEYQKPKKPTYKIYTILNYQGIEISYNIGTTHQRVVCNCKHIINAEKICKLLNDVEKETEL